MDGYPRSGTRHRATLWFPYTEVIHDRYFAVHQRVPCLKFHNSCTNVMVLSQYSQMPAAESNYLRSKAKPDPRPEWQNLRSHPRHIRSSWLINPLPLFCVSREIRAL